jgi:hypothetical protein
MITTILIINAICLIYGLYQASQKQKQINDLEQRLAQAYYKLDLKHMFDSDSKRVIAKLINYETVKIKTLGQEYYVATYKTIEKEPREIKMEYSSMDEITYEIIV